MPNGIDLILADHERVNELFQQFDETGDATLVGQIVGALVAHDEAEHGALYPLSLLVLDDADLIVAFDDAHAGIKRLIEHLVQLEGPPLVDAVAALRDAVTAHVADEEKKLLPQLGKAATVAQLDELAARIEHVKQRAG
jgi:hemerythrin superfamily protein